MKYIAYKMKFHTAVRFGDGMLNETESHFCADTLFSGLCLEAVKLGDEVIEKLFRLAKNEEIVFSDGFPFIGENLYIPKPMTATECASTDLVIRKLWKRLQYVPLERVDDFFSGHLDVQVEMERLKELGKTQIISKVSLINKEKTEPYTIGAFRFKQGNGLYFFFGYEKEENKKFVENLLLSLSYEGIGGKTSSGLGKFSFEEVALSDDIQTRLKKENGRFVVLTTSLPTDEEMEEVIVDAEYSLVKRSGFIHSVSYAREFVKKQEKYFLKSGSVVGVRYHGDIYDVGLNGSHAVWRYACPIFMEVSE